MHIHAFSTKGESYCPHFKSGAWVVHTFKPNICNVLIHENQDISIKYGVDSYNCLYDNNLLFHVAYGTKCFALDDTSSV